MLFVNKKYESIDRLLNEKLSQDKIDEFSNWLANSSEANELKDDKLDEYKNRLQGISLTNKYIDQFKERGIDPDTTEKFITVLAKYKAMNILEMCGSVKFSSLNDSGNIFDALKIDHGLGTLLAELKNTSTKGKQKTSQEGEFEVLLRFFLDGGNSVSSRGDVLCSDGTIEVKVSQDARPGESYKNSSEILGKIDKAIDDNITSRTTAKYSGTEPLAKYYTNHEKDLALLSAGYIADAVVEGVCALYGISSGKDSLKNSANRYFTKVNYELLRNLIGLTELAAYSQLSKFNYIIFFKDTGGKYKYYRSNQLLDFSLVANDLHIQGLGSGLHRGDAVAKIGLK